VRKVSSGERRGEREKGESDGELENHPSLFALSYMDGLLSTRMTIWCSFCKPHDGRTVRFPRDTFQDVCPIFTGPTFAPHLGRKKKIGSKEKFERWSENEVYVTATNGGTAQPAHWRVAYIQKQGSVQEKQRQESGNGRR